jgi:hypothetical protein
MNHTARINSSFYAFTLTITLCPFAPRYHVVGENPIPAPLAAKRWVATLITTNKEFVL